MLLLRRMFFYAFALIYLIVCPLVIARMLGFVINPDTHTLVKTGLIYISTNPPGANVFVDGRQGHEPTPTVIRDLAPGKHFIRLQLNGYKDWEKNIPVTGNKATILDNTLLVPGQWPIQKISAKTYKDILTSAAPDGLLLGINPVLKNIRIFRIDAADQSSTPLFSSHSIYADGNLVRIFKANRSPFVLPEAQVQDKQKFFWVDLRENPPAIEDITDLFPQPPQDIAWDASDENTVYAFYSQGIYRINLKAKSIYPQAVAGLPPAIHHRSSDYLQQGFSFNNGNDLLVRTGSLVRIYPKENFGEPDVYDVVSSHPSTNMYFEQKTGRLFYLDTAGYLCSVQILEHHPVLSISIPDGLRVKKTDLK